jgi:hypothetical protein
MLKSIGTIKGEEAYLTDLNLYGKDEILSRSSYIKHYREKFDIELEKNLGDMMERKNILKRKYVVFKTVLKELETNQQSVVKKILKREGIEIVTQPEFKNLKTYEYIENYLLSDLKSLPNKIKSSVLNKIISERISLFVKSEVYEPSFYYGVNFFNVLEDDEFYRRPIFLEAIEIISSKLMGKDHSLPEGKIGDFVKSFRVGGKKDFYKSLLEVEKNNLTPPKENFNFKFLAEYKNLVKKIFGANIISGDDIKSQINQGQRYTNYISPEIIKVLRDEKIFIWDKSPMTQSSIKPGSVFISTKKIEMRIESLISNGHELTRDEIATLTTRFKKRIKIKEYK